MCGCGCLLILLIIAGIVFTIINHLWFLMVLLIFLALASGGFGWKITRR